ncbi:MAG TPA: S16 family serine protease [Desulfopila sp.]|nr:S16 family serine protease [Desulfopila sp.]
MNFFKKSSKVAEAEPEHRTNETTPLDLIRKKIDAGNLPRHAMDAVKRELEKLEKTDPGLAEYTVGLNYIQLVISLPWSTSTKGHLELERAKSVLDTRHSGLLQVKERVLEFLAARSLREKARKRILLVDDEEIARDNMAHFLRKDGFHCSCAHNGVAALSILEEEDIDLIISDLKMEQMDGLELLAKANRLYPDIPVVLVTGFATVDSAVKALKNGAAHYLGKPVNLEELKKTANEVLQKKQIAEIGRGPILCFTGPPGTGKTSVGKSIAEALQLEFTRISLAALHDEAELRGHRRTYVGAMPGRIITELQRLGVNNPVFMLDEIDKIGQDFRGDPASVMLEVLDPEQNIKFTDYYLDVPFDLSRIMFIATANDLTQLPGPLLDRMELIEFTGYTEKEKNSIARQFIIPRQLKAAGLDRTSIRFSRQAVTKIINDYTRESGVRNLEREVANVGRKIALQHLTGREEGMVEIGEDDVRRLLGPRKYIRNAAESEPKVGITTGLVWSAAGGEIISVETALMKGDGRLILTGSLGDILQESAQTTLSLIKSRAGMYDVNEELFGQKDIHIHFPAGAVAKDGPSAGITIFVALLSLLTRRPARRDIAMTGEMSLSGRILPVSGIKEKLLAAQRAGIRKVFLPADNAEEVETLADDVREGLVINLVKDGDEVIDSVLLPAEA